MKVEHNASAGDIAVSRAIGRNAMPNAGSFARSLGMPDHTAFATAGSAGAAECSEQPERTSIAGSGERVGAAAMTECDRGQHEPMEVSSERATAVARLEGGSADGSGMKRWKGGAADGAEGVAEDASRTSEGHAEGAADDRGVVQAAAAGVMMGGTMERNAMPHAGSFARSLGMPDHTAFATAGSAGAAECSEQPERTSIAGSGERVGAAAMTECDRGQHEPMEVSSERATAVARLEGGSADGSGMKRWKGGAADGAEGVAEDASRTSEGHAEGAADDRVVVAAPASLSQSTDSQVHNHPTIHAPALSKHLRICAYRELQWMQWMLDV